MKIEFDTWKAEYEPRIYEDSGAECFDHEECECEFLYTFELQELEQDEEDSSAIAENRVWSWLTNGDIVSGIVIPNDLLVTKKPWTERTWVN